MPYKVKLYRNKPTDPEKFCFRGGHKFSNERYSHLRDEESTQEISRDKQLETIWIDEVEYQEGIRAAKKRRWNSLLGGIFGKKS